MDALKAQLDRPELVERFVATFKQRAAAKADAEDSERKERQHLARDSERRIANLTESLAKLGWSDALAAKLREEEACLARLKTDSAAGSKGETLRALPDATTIAGYFRKLLALLEANPVRGRELLSRFVAPVVMTPEVDLAGGATTQREDPPRRYRASGAFNLSFFLSAPRPEVEVKYGCAGRI